MTIEERVLKSISATFNIDLEKILVTNTKDDIESWDSLGHLQLIMGLESEFNIKFKTNEIGNIESISDCIDIVNKYTNT